MNGFWMVNFKKRNNKNMLRVVCESDIISKHVIYRYVSSGSTLGSILVYNNGKNDPFIVRVGICNNGKFRTFRIFYVSGERSIDCYDMWRNIKEGGLLGVKCDDKVNGLEVRCKIIGSPVPSSLDFLMRD